MNGRERWILKRIFSMALISVFSFVGVAFGQTPFAPEPPARTELRETIFRYMFEHFSYGPDVKVLCIQRETPQPERFLLRFSANQHRVVWASACEMFGPMNGLKETKSGERAVRMTIISIESINSHEAEVHVEAFSDGIAANRNVLRMARENGHWIVKRDTPNGVS